MNKRIKDATPEDLEDFTTLTNPLLRYIRDNWNCDVSPKGYVKYLESYEEYDDMGKKIPKFDGLLDTSATCPPFPDRISMPQVAYDDTQQGRDPLTTLVGALVGYGMAIGERRAKLDGSSTRDNVRIKGLLEDLLEGNTVSDSRLQIVLDLMEISHPDLFK